MPFCSCSLRSQYAIVTQPRRRARSRRRALSSDELQTACPVVEVVVTERAVHAEGLRDIVGSRAGRAVVPHAHEAVGVVLHGTGRVLHRLTVVPLLAVELREIAGERSHSATKTIVLEEVEPPCYGDTVRCRRSGGRAHHQHRCQADQRDKWQTNTFYHRFHLLTPPVTADLGRVLLAKCGRGTGGVDRCAATG